MFIHVCVMDNNQALHLWSVHLSMCPSENVLIDMTVGNVFNFYPVDRDNF